MATVRRRVPSSTHSVRAPEDVWRAAKARGIEEGVRMNTIIVELLEGYGRGLIHLPRVTKTYLPQSGATRKPAPADTDE